VTVDAAGNVSDAAFESEGPSQYFAKAALQAARQWKFPPAQASGQSEASARMLEFKFTRDGAEVASLAAQ
jgi:TonB family protein